MYKQPDAGEPPVDKISEMSKLERPGGLENVLDSRSMHILVSLDLQSFDSLYNAFDSFLSDAPLFEGDTSFSQAASALDATANLFSQIDINSDHLLDHNELAYLLQNTTSENTEALQWLMDHFDAFSQACFFTNGISKDDLESARNVFHGLRHVHENFGFDEEASPETLQHLDAERIQNYLNDNRDTLEPHDAAGLQQLLEYLKEHSGNTAG